MASGSRLGPSTGLFVLLIAANAPAPATDMGADKDLQKLLARPPSPGVLALLAAHVNQPGVADRVRLGLSSSDWKTRATAARLVDLGALRELIPAVQDLLGKETQALAAGEELRALATIGGPEFDEATLAAERRFSPGLDADFAHFLARARGPRAVPIYFDVLRGWKLSEAATRTFFRLATRGQHDALVSASAIALSRRDPVAWQAILDVASEAHARIDDPVLIAGLRFKEGQLRGEAAWYAAKSYDGAPPSNTADILAALSEGERDAEPVGPELRFGSEILRRVLGKEPVEDEAWIACLESSLTCHLDSDFEDSPLIEYLTEREREAVQRRNHANRPANLPEKKRATNFNPGQALLRLVSGLPVGVAQDLFQIESCQSGALTRWLSLAAVEYRPDGLPRRVTIATEPSGPSCQRTSRALFLMSDAPSSEADAASSAQSYLALFDPAMYECADRAAIAALEEKPVQDPIRVRGQVTPPMLQKKVQPIYPPSSRKNKEEGVSVIGAIISAEGCVEFPEVLQSATPTLDIMAMEGVTRWRYQPATLDGRPIRVFLTVSVNFHLTP